MRTIRCATVLAVLSATAAPAGAQTAIPAIPGLPPIPDGLGNSPIVRSILDQVGGATQSTTGPEAFGRVTYFKRYDLELRTAPGVYRVVHLHPGTEIFPRGATPLPGMQAQVSGRPESDGSLDADRIVTR